ncbi:MAG: hypothetical protein ABFD81_12705 [Syntrophaceae bacterium]
MEEEKKIGQKNKTKAILIMSIIIFAIGFGLGFYVFGYHKKSSTDYKQSLREVIAYIDALEKDRNELSAKLKSLDAQREPLKEGAQSGVPQTVSLQERLEALERENASLRSSMSQNQALLQENYQLRGRLQVLEGQMNPQGGGAALQRTQPETPPTTPAPR